MKRGLKDRGETSTAASPTRVTTIAPMKRGLKALDDYVEGGAHGVTTIAPMKRGLKEHQTEQQADSNKVLQPLPR